MRNRVCPATHKTIYKQTKHTGMHVTRALDKTDKSDSYMDIYIYNITRSAEDK